MPLSKSRFGSVINDYKILDAIRTIQWKSYVFRTQFERTAAQCRDVDRRVHRLDNRSRPADRYQTYRRRRKNGAFFFKIPTYQTPVPGLCSRHTRVPRLLPHSIPVLYERFTSVSFGLESRPNTVAESFRLFFFARTRVRVSSVRLFDLVSSCIASAIDVPRIVVRFRISRPFFWPHCVEACGVYRQSTTEIHKQNRKASAVKELSTRRVSKTVRYWNIGLTYDGRDPKFWIVDNYNTITAFGFEHFFTQTATTPFVRECRIRFTGR